MTQQHLLDIIAPPLKSSATALRTISPFTQSLFDEIHLLPLQPIRTPSMLASVARALNPRPTERVLQQISHHIEHSIQNTHTFAEAIAGLQALYAIASAEIPVLTAFASVPLYALEQRDITNPEGSIETQFSQFSHDWNKLWGLMQYFPQINNDFEHGGIPDNIYFRSAWYWFRHRHKHRGFLVAGEYEADVAIARFHEYFGERRSEVFTQFVTAEQPYPELQEYEPSSSIFATFQKAHWNCAVSLVEQRDALRSAVLVGIDAARGVMLRRAALLAERGVIESMGKSMDVLWQMSVDEVRRLDNQ